MENSFLTKYDITKLLGLNLKQEEKEKYMEEITDICIKKAFYTLYREGEISEELFNEIEPIILSEEKNYDITEHVGHLRKKVEEAMIKEANDYKKLSLLEQIEDFMKYAKKKNIKDSEITKTIPQLVHSLNSDGENLQKLLQKYNKLKIQHSYEPKI